RHYRRRLHDLGQQVAFFRSNPSTQTFSSPDFRQELGPLVEPLEALCASYRQVLADRVAQGEALESLRSLLGRVDAERTSHRTIVQRVSGSSRNMVARLTPNLRWMAATPALSQLLGVSFNDLTGRAFPEVVHPEDHPGLRRAFQEALQTGEA